MGSKDVILLKSDRRYGNWKHSGVGTDLRKVNGEDRGSASSPAIMTVTEDTVLTQRGEIKTRRDLGGILVARQ